MSTRFGVQKTPIYGSYGEFTIGEKTDSLRAKYILTKMKPGNDGSWECELASQMKPWREIFNVEEMGFEELLQRELDDSRVAHDLIPYLLGESGDRAQFFPPILAVIVPRKQDETGIEKYYPSPDLDPQNQYIETYGELFSFQQVVWDNEPTPLATLSYNRQRSAFIIVDGQHRAMAVLALHRQLNDNWGDNAFASYYDHIEVKAEQINNIELPVCIIFFPDLHEENTLSDELEIDLTSVCREIFLVVNRSAKIVSEVRRLLLDDEDIAAYLMRKTLSTLKKRSEDLDELSRIYSISYGDSDTEIGQKEVVSGQLEYSSAVTLHKVHRALFFGPDGAFKIDGYEDITDRRKLRNRIRPTEILLGTQLERHQTIPHNSGKTLPPQEVSEIVDYLGDLADIVLLSLFDKFRPFTIHNSELRNLRRRLLDPQVRSEIEQKKAYNLIFDGSGVRNVFESHLKRLKDEKNNPIGDTDNVPTHLHRQVEFCETVSKILDNHKLKFQQHRACQFFSINPDMYNNKDKVDDQIKLNQIARSLFQETLATQAFQIGYTMAIFSVVEEIKRLQSVDSPLSYSQRLELIKFVTNVYITGLNTYFSPGDDTEHRSLSGYISEDRACVFDKNSHGLRGLLIMSVKELNEKQWRFFRYALLEIIHSPICWDSAVEKMKQDENKWCLEWYKNSIPRLVVGIISERKKYIADAVDTALKDGDFQDDLKFEEHQAQLEGKSETEIQQIIEKLRIKRTTEVEKRAHNHLKASLKKIQSHNDMVTRLLVEL